MSKNKSRDAGLAAVLILLIIVFFRTKHPDPFLVAAGVALVFLMSIPGVFRPFAVLWFFSAGVLGKVVSTVLLAGIFFFLATPVGLLARLFGHDPLFLKRWKKGKESLFVKRDHRFSDKDLRTPF